MIHIEQLSKSYGSKSVLKNISLNIPTGKIIGIVGENGAGKSTLFRCIAGLESHEGTCTSSYTSLKNVLGFLSAEPYLFSKMTGADYLNFMAASRNQAFTLLEEHNLFDLPLNKFVSSYSTGMKKKLALTALLVQKNQVFILDEPFNGLDIQSNLVLSHIIQKLKNANRTILISSHIYITLTELCDCMYHLKDGILSTPYYPSDYGKLEELLKDSVISEKLEGFVV